MPHRPRDSVSRPLRRVRLLVEELELRLAPSLLGQNLFPDNSPFNQVIANAPIAPNSNAIIQYIENQYPTGERGTPQVDGNADYDLSNANEDPAYGIPYNVVHGNNPDVQYLTVQLLPNGYLSQSDVPSGATSITVPYTGVLQEEVGGDHHLIIYDIDNELDYEFYNAQPPSVNGTTSWTATYVGIWDVKTNTYQTLGYTSADAAGLPILPLLLRPDEALPVSEGGQGVIDHALRFTLPSAYVQNDTYAYPASHDTVGGNANALPYIGMRLRLKPNVNLPGITGAAETVVKALQTYGMILADRGGDNITAADYSVDDQNNKVLTWENSDGSLGLTDLVYAFGQVIPMSDFQVVNLTPVVNSVSPSAAVPGDYVTVHGQNFSGAGGRISVLFGATPATATPSPNVTVINDTTVVAQVPVLPITGVVGERIYVQFGVVETDANTTYDAVGDSISNSTKVGTLWGYGISTEAVGLMYIGAGTYYSNEPVGFTDDSGNQYLFYSYANGTIAESMDNGSGWSAVPVTAAAGTTIPSPLSELDAFTETEDGTTTTHLIYVDTHDHLDDVWQAAPGGQWQVNDLTSLLPAGAIPLGNPSVFFAGDTRHIVLRVRYEFASAVASGQQSLIDIATDPSGQTTVQDLLALVSSGGNPPPGQPQTGSPPPRAPYVAGDPVGYAVSYTADAGQVATELHYFFRDTFGGIDTIWQDAAGVWHYQQLSAAQGLNNTAIGTPSAWVGGNTQYIAYRNQDGQVEELSLAVGDASAAWQLVPLGSAVPDLPAACSNPQGFAVNGQPCVMYFDQSGALVEVMETSSASGSPTWSYQAIATTVGGKSVRGAGDTDVLLATADGLSVVFNDTASRRLLDVSNATGTWTVSSIGPNPSLSTVIYPFSRRIP